jgi:acyl-CoA reductase-like NAD-dependent aldehyde dehydrogenase
VIDAALLDVGPKPGRRKIVLARVPTELLPRSPTAGFRPCVFTRDNREIMRVKELAFGEIYVNRPSGESPNGFHTGHRKSGLSGEDGPHGIEGFMRKKTMYKNFA